MYSAVLDIDAVDFGAMLVRLTAAEGTASHPWTIAPDLNAGPLANRNLADTLHLLSMLHGTHPGLIELAGERSVLPAADDWFLQATAGFAAERLYITQLIVVAGPAPGTPGESETAAAVLAQRHALETIAESDRFGCAVGAAAALVLDWQAVRAVLDTAAARIGLDVPPSLMPDEASTSALLAQLPPRPRLDRTLAFGARQLLVQQRGLWDLLETRAGARAETADA